MLGRISVMSSISLLVNTGHNNILEQIGMKLMFFWQCPKALNLGPYCS